MSRLTDDWYYCCYNADCKKDFMMLEYSMNEMYLSNRIPYDIYEEMKATYNYYKRIFDITDTRKRMELD